MLIAWINVKRALNFYIMCIYTFSVIYRINRERFPNTNRVVFVMDIPSVYYFGGKWMLRISQIIFMLQTINQFILAPNLFLLWRCDPTRVMASSFLRFLDHTQRRTTVGRTPLDEWSTHRRDLYLTTRNTHNRHTAMPPGGIRTHDLSRRAAADLRLRARGHWDRLLLQNMYLKEGYYKN
jgi:hypothetical protein